MEKRREIKVTATEAAFSSFLSAVIYLILYSMEGYQFVSLIVLAVAFFFYFISLEKLKCKEEYGYGHLVMISGGILLAASVYLLCNISEALASKKFYFLISCCMMILFNLFCVIRYRRAIIKQVKQIRIRNVCKNNSIILMELFVLTIIYFFQNSNVQPRWDNSILYRILINENGTEFFNINKLFITTYLRSAFCIYNAFWAGVVPDTLLAMHIGQYFVFAIGIIYFYRLLKIMFPQKNKSGIALVTLLYAVNPFVLGASSNVNWDYYSMQLFLPVLYYWIQKNRYMHSLWCILFLFTKEVNVIIYFGLVLGSFVLEIKQNSFRCALRESRYFDALRLMISAAFIGIIGLLHEEKVMGGVLILWIALIAIVFVLERCRARLIRFFSKKQNCILIVFACTVVVIAGIGFAVSRFNNGLVGWNGAFILQKMKVLFVLNFNWLLSLFAIGGIVVALKNRHLKKTVISMLCADAIFVVFSCFFLTYNHPRYIDIHQPILCLLVAIALVAYAKKLIGPLVGTVLAALLGVQNYKTVDPLTRGVFYQIEYGDSVIITTSDVEPISDSVVYNYEWTWFDKTINLALSEVVMNNRLLFFPKHSFYFEGNNMVSGEQYWDQNRNLRLLYENKSTVPIHIRVPKSEETLKELSAGDPCYYFYTDYYGTEYRNQLAEDQVIIEEKSYSKGGCKIYRVFFSYE
ncbi:MAG: DUF2079 domain-containing protein [Lachnospiraceae bacterium]|nr:DUF2079 domain-containing protein [Lachnospiraceae bacterium]